MSVSAGFFAEKVHDRVNAGVGSIQSGNFDIDCRGSGGGAETDERVVDRGTGFLTEGAHFFVRVVRYLLLGKKNETGGDVRRKVGLGEADVRAKSRGLRHQPKSQVSVAPCLSSFALADWRLNRFFSKSAQVTGL